MYAENKILSIPSGEILNCHSELIYNMFLFGYLKRQEYYNGFYVNMYSFKSINRKTIFDYISENIKIGYFVRNKKEGLGVILSNNGKTITIKYNNNTIQGVNIGVFICSMDFEFLDGVDIDNDIKNNLIK